MRGRELLYGGADADRECKGTPDQEFFYQLIQKTHHTRQPRLKSITQVRPLGGDILHKKEMNRRKSLMTNATKTASHIRTPVIARIPDNTGSLVPGGVSSGGGSGVSGVSGVSIVTVVSVPRDEFSATALLVESTVLL